MKQSSWTMWRSAAVTSFSCAGKQRRNQMGTNARRNFVRKIAATVVYLTGTKLCAQQAPAASTSSSTPPSNTDKDTPRRSGGEHHIQDGIYYISGTGSNDGYPKEDHVLVTDPFEKHVTRTMEALKK